MSLSQAPNPASSDRHICHCGKDFARKEHLTRHQSTHERPAYVCNVCRRRFTRKEVLRRHSLLHDPERTRVNVSCDACRVNKTKCSGVDPCSLCVRRGIDCTFRANHSRARGVSTSKEPSKTNIDLHVDNGDGSVLSQNSRSDGVVADTPLRTDPTLRDHEWIHDIVIVPSKSTSSSDFRPSGPRSRAILELLLTDEPSLEAAAQQSDELQEWLTQCFRSYLGNFHLRWPVLNGPSFDPTTALLPLTASVCVIGTWLCDSANQDEKLDALRIHEILLKRLIHNVIDFGTVLEGQPWPLELLQATLLTLILSLYRTNKSVVSRTMILQGVFITSLRQKGMFDAKVLADHLRTNFTGPFAPYTISMRERFRRLLALTYQFDAYFALAHGKPPILHRQEIGVDLTITFALWNAHGLDIFARRVMDEPTDRTGIQISAMTDSPGACTLSRLLVEDVVLGLCGVLQAMWTLMQSSPPQTKSHHSKNFQKALLIETLDSWKHELDKIERLASVENIKSDAAKYLLLAYRGEDESVSSILERICILAQDGMVLYHLLRMHHYAGPRLPEMIGQTKQNDSSWKEIWWTTENGRGALVSALQILKMARSNNDWVVSFHPLHYHALVVSAELIKRVLASCERCTYLIEEGQRAYQENLQQWIEVGGPLCNNGTRSCACKLVLWTAEFERMIQGQTITTEVVVDTIEP